jgi:5-methylcytosine-specific restriction endonuclease McrA
VTTRRKYTEEMLTAAVARSSSVAGVLRDLGVRPTGGAHAHISRTIKSFGIDTSHFQLYNPASHSSRRLTPEEILVRSADDARRAEPPMLTRALIESGIAYECGLCRCDGTWLGMPLTLEVDHIDGDYRNNLIDNLRFLCPNCHRQTPSFAGRSKGKFSGHTAALRAMGSDS